MKSKQLALIFSFFLGWAGVHRFYTGKILTGLLWLFTGGLFGIGALVDFILIATGNFRDKNGNLLEDDAYPIITVIFSIFYGLAILSIILIFAVAVLVSSNTIESDYVQNNQYSSEESSTDLDIDSIIDELEGSTSSDIEVQNNDTPNIEDKQEDTVYTEVELQSLFDELDSNALRAEKTYQNTYIEFTGYIASFDSDGSYISIRATDSEWDFDRIMCNFTNDTQLDYALNLNVGDKVTVRGEITSIGEVLGYILDIHSIQ